MITIVSEMKIMNLKLSIGKELNPTAIAMENNDNNNDNFENSGQGTHYFILCLSNNLPHYNLLQKKV